MAVKIRLLRRKSAPWCAGSNGRGSVGPQGCFEAPQMGRDFSRPCAACSDCAKGKRAENTGLAARNAWNSYRKGEANGAARQPLGAAPSDSYRRSALQCEGQAGEAGGNVSCRDPEAATQPSAPPGSVCALEGVLPPYRDPSPARGASAVRGALPPYPDPSLPLPRAERPCADGRACGAARGRCGDDKEGRTSRDGDGDGERSYQGGGKGGLTDWGK